MKNYLFLIIFYSSLRLFAISNALIIEQVPKINDSVNVFCRESTGVYQNIQYPKYELNTKDPNSEPIVIGTISFIAFDWKNVGSYDTSILKKEGIKNVYGTVGEVTSTSISSYIADIGVSSVLNAFYITASPDKNSINFYLIVQEYYYDKNENFGSAADICSVQSFYRSELPSLKYFSIYKKRGNNNDIVRFKIIILYKTP